MKDIEVRQKVLNELKNIPVGSVTTYGAIARKLGISPRQVGRILHTNTDTQTYPCHRVVFSDGRLSPGYAYGGLEGQSNRLKAEGIEIFNNKVIGKLVYNIIVA